MHFYPYHSLLYHSKIRLVLLAEYRNKLSICCCRDTFRGNNIKIYVRVTVSTLPAPCKKQFSLCKGEYLLNFYTRV